MEVIEMSKTILFVTLICFWTMMAILSNMFSLQLTNTGITDLNPKSVSHDQQAGAQISFIEKIFTFLEDVPIVNNLVPLFRILTFQYTDQVPVAVTMLLDMTFFFTAFLVLDMMRFR